MPTRLRSAFPLVAAAMLLASGGDLAMAQESCSRLQAELARVDGRPGGARYEAAFREQAAVLQRTEDRARRAGCFGGNFLFFRNRPSPECRVLIPQIRTMQAKLSEIDRLRRGGGDARRAGQIRARMASLGCGTGSRARPREEYVVNRGTYRTLCVRRCDGYYFPISFAARRGQFADDAALCRRACGSSAELFYYPNPGSAPEDMVSLAGQSYTNLPAAFRYRESYDPGCSCRPEERSFTMISTELPLRGPVPAEPPRDLPALPEARPIPGEDPETAANRRGEFDPARMAASAAVSGAPKAAGGVRIVGDLYWGERPSDSLLLTPIPN